MPIVPPPSLDSATGSDWEVVEPSPSAGPTDKTHDFFFYGTLLVPAILVRVLGHDCANMTFQDALLPDYTRHCVKNEDYPAVINRDKTAELVPRDQVLFPEDMFTRGTVVKGLSYADVQALDIFEGTQYSRIKLPVQTLSPPMDIAHLPKSLSEPDTRQAMNKQEAVQAAEHLRDGTMPEDDQRGPEKQIGEVQVWVYVWSDDLTFLEPSIWKFGDFLRDRAHVWTGLDTTEYQEVERHRALNSLPGYKQGPAESPDQSGMDGEEGKVLGVKMEGYPDFGHPMRRYFKFEKDYVNMNHGSYGSPPIPVIDAMREMSDHIETFPDRFMRRDYLPKLLHVREQLAEMVHARTDEVVIVPNATHGVNNIVTQINWSDGDVIVIFSSTYGAIGQTMKHLCDRIPGLKLEVIDVTFPCSHQAILSKTEEVIKRYNVHATPNYSGEARPTGQTPHERIRMIVVDSIASMPGVVYPWQGIVRLCKKYGILSMVDGAHSIGQQPLDLPSIDCDFFVSNCHKWLMSHRGGAVLYVPIRNQHLIRSTFPTSFGYESTRYPTEGTDRPWSFANQYDWTGTLDWTPLLGITSAIEWRKSLGGEERIMAHNHSLAVQGGRRVRKLWRTEMIENRNKEDGELTAAMANLFLPDCGDTKDLDDRFKQYKYFEQEMFEAKVFAAIYWHAGRWCARFSAQIWNELSDFEHVANVLSGICERVKRGDYKQVSIPATDTLKKAEDLPVVDVE